MFKKFKCICFFKCTKIYNLSLSEKTIKLIEKDFTVPAIYEYKMKMLLPMYAGETIFGYKSIN